MKNPKKNPDKHLKHHLDSTMATTIDLSSFEQEIGSAIRRDAQIEDIIELCEEYEIEVLLLLYILKGFHFRGIRFLL